MSFSPKVKEDALVACRRCCALCEKFCGLKIELHHIKPAAEGRDDTFENCIPLCLDHHVEVGQRYNTKHPKGTKYTEKELKRIRDDFYIKIQSKNSSSIISEALSKNYEKILVVLKFLYDKCVMKNQLGCITAYQARLHSYDNLCSIFLNEGIDKTLLNEILCEMEQQHFIKTDLRKDPSGDLCGSVKIEQEGVAFYERNL